MSANDFAKRVDGVLASRPTIVLHVGEPKTGTTFLQATMWRNRSVLAEHGVMLPGASVDDQLAATLDLRQMQQDPTDPSATWMGRWAVIAADAARANRVALISHELLAAATEAQAARAVNSFPGCHVHVVLTVRDMATLLPAEWIESVKHRNSRTWRDWLGDVIDVEAVSADRRQFWFWRVHDTVEILRIWSAHLPRENVHIITVPPRGMPRDTLWKRMAQLLGVDPAIADLSETESNASLGVAETEFLRRVNAALPPRMSDWFYTAAIKERFAYGTLADQPARGRLVLPDDRVGWAGAHASLLIDYLRTAGFDVLGDLDELRPAPPSGVVLDPATLPAEQLLDAALAGVSGYFAAAYDDTFPSPSTAHTRPPLPDRLIAAITRSPRVRQLARRLNVRYVWLFRFRALWARLFERHEGHE